MSKDDRKAIFEYIQEFSMYEDVTVNGQRYILTHSGLPEKSNLKNLHKFDL
jgi:serine/threonine protein phosphatase 1